MLHVPGAPRHTPLFPLHGIDTGPPVSRVHGTAIFHPRVLMHAPSNTQPPRPGKIGSNLLGNLPLSQNRVVPICFSPALQERLLHSTWWLGDRKPPRAIRQERAWWWDLPLRLLHRLQPAPRNWSSVSCVLAHTQDRRAPLGAGEVTCLSTGAVSAVGGERATAPERNS